MTAEMDDREWEAFMSNAVGLSVSESGLLIDLDPQPSSTGWVSSECVNDTDGDGNCAACARNPQAPCRRPKTARPPEAVA
jgi:hypothetical protein